MISINVNTKEFDKKNIKLNKAFTTSWKQIFSKYGALIVERASKFHKYRNRSGNLSKSNKWKVSRNGSVLTVSNTSSYAKYVDRWEKSKGSKGWLVNAMNYYRKNMTKDFMNATKYFKGV